MPEPERISEREGTPERLRAFRAEYAKTSSAGRAMAVAQLVILLLGFAGVFALLMRDNSSADSSSIATGTGESQRQLAAYLAEKNQPELALQAYEDYLDYAASPSADRARVCYSVASLALDLELYSKALKYLYESELLDPTSDLSDDIDKKIVLCLEKLGRSETLRRELRTRSSLNQSAAAAGDATILAEFAGEVITDRDLDREIEKLPASVRSSFEDPEEKAEFLKNLVAERLLLDKAVRSGLDQDEEVQETINRQRDSLIVRRLIDEEVRAKLTVSDEDVERFYKAEIQRFTTPASAQGTIGIATDEQAALDAAASDSAQRVTISDQRVQGADLTDATAKALSEKILGSMSSDVIATVESEGSWYAFRGTFTAVQTQPFEAVKDRAAQMYRAQKEQELLQDLIAKTLEARNVKLYPERLQAAKEPAQ